MSYLKFDYLYIILLRLVVEHSTILCLFHSLPIKFRILIILPYTPSMHICVNHTKILYTFSWLLVNKTNSFFLYFTLQFHFIFLFFPNILFYKKKMSAVFRCFLSVFLYDYGFGYGNFTSEVT